MRRKATRRLCLDRLADGPVAAHVGTVGHDEYPGTWVGLFLPDGFDADGVLLTPDDARALAIALIERAREAEE